MNVRILARTITYDATNERVLLVKNKDTDFWYAPGGGWEQDCETIQECAVREVYEETGLNVIVNRLLYVQEFHESSETIFFETFWLAEPAHTFTLNENHVGLDPNGSVEEARWFHKDELRDLKVFPKRLKASFWDVVDAGLAAEDPFIGVS